LHDESIQKNTGKLNSLSISEQVCIGWHRTCAYCIAKLTFSHGSSTKVWSTYHTSVCIIFKFLWQASTTAIVPGPQYTAVNKLMHTCSCELPSHGGWSWGWTGTTFPRQPAEQVAAADEQ